MALCPSQYRYLLAIYELTQQHNSIRCVDVANHLSVTRPSVSKMMKCMVNSGLVEPDYCKNITLTKMGLHLAQEYSANPAMLYAFFHRMLKLPPEEAQAQTMLFLSTFPLETSKKLTHVMEKSIIAAKSKATKSI